MDVAFRWIQLRPRPGLQAAGSDEPASRAPHRGERKIVFREATRGMDAKEPLERSATNNCESPTLVAASFWWTPQQPRRHRRHCHRVCVPRGTVDAADAELARCKRRVSRHRVASADAGVLAVAPDARSPHHRFSASLSTRRCSSLVTPFAPLSAPSTHLLITNEARLARRLPSLRSARAHRGVQPTRSRAFGYARYRFAQRVASAHAPQTPSRLAGVASSKNFVTYQS